ncbi:MULTISPECIES: PAS domain-containing protein [Methylobacterium]|uniref:PAS domain-containing protein n=1 Tax=Methylobacterium TaxID=407 RepID=UPI0013ED7C02|nr:PAS domain S-box protein [Methylobacterium sp. DB0501]NGM34073.1 PAS domain S-box protein [Methylobacterium sp. DB0501]
MELTDLVRMFAEPLDLAVVVTDADLERPGPTVLYANPAFARMSGYALAEVMGATPRILQGSDTNREATRYLRRLLRAEGRFVGCLRNYRKGGDEYLCEIDIRPILGRNGIPQAYIAFEREVVRRRGRPPDGGTRRYRSIVQSPLPWVGDGMTLFA